MAKRSSLTVVGVLVAAFLGAAGCHGLPHGATAEAQPAALKAVRTQAVILVDAEGREIGRLGVLPEGLASVLKDEQGRERIRLGNTGGDEPYWALVFGDAEGHNRFTCGARADGKGSGMGIQDWNGTLRVGLGAAEYGCGLALHNEHGVGIIGAGVGAGGGGDFVLKHPYDGREMWRASQHIEQGER